MLRYGYDMPKTNAAVKRPVPIERPSTPLRLWLEAQMKRRNISYADAVRDLALALDVTTAFVYAIADGSRRPGWSMASKMEKETKLPIATWARP